MKRDDKRHAIIHVHHTTGTYTSIPLEMSDGSSDTQLVLRLTEEGTHDLQMLKIPTSETSFVVICQPQLSESIVEIELLNIMKPKRGRPAKVEMIKS